jgi:predicted dehydrogenase
MQGSGSRRQIRIGVVGAGEMGTLYSEICVDHAGTELIGVCGRPGTLEPPFALPSGARWYPDHATLLAKAAPDALIVASPSPSHRTVVVDAFTAGADVLCEKPLAHTLQDCDAMLAAADKAGRRLAVIYPFRTSRIFGAVAQQLKAVVGEPLLAQTVRMEHPAVWGWYRARDGIRSLFHEVVTHELDALTGWLGEPLSVSASGVERGRADVDYPTSVTVTVRYRGGAIGIATASWASSLLVSSGSIVGTTGAVQFDWRRGTVESAVHGGAPHRRRIREEWRAPYRRQVADFVSWVQSGRPVALASGWDGRRAVAIAEAALASLVSGTSTELEPDVKAGLG